MSDITIIHGDCLDVLPTLDLTGPTALVTDPPYGLGEKWQGGTRQWALSDNGRGTEWDSVPAAGVAEMVARFDHAIVWGGHLFGLPVARGWLVSDNTLSRNRDAPSRCARSTS